METNYSLAKKILSIIDTNEVGALEKIIQLCTEELLYKVEDATPKKQKLYNVLMSMLKNAKKEKYWLREGFIDDGKKYMYLTNTHWLVKFSRINVAPELITNFISPESAEKIFDGVYNKLSHYKEYTVNYSDFKQYMATHRTLALKKEDPFNVNGVLFGANYFKHLFSLSGKKEVIIYLYDNHIAYYKDENVEFVLCPLIHIN